MTNKYEALEELAKNATQDLAFLEAMRGVDRFLEAVSPATILSLLADMKEMQEALQMASFYVSVEGSDEQIEQVEAALQRVKGES